MLAATVGAVVVMIIPADRKTWACTGRIVLCGFCPGALLNPRVRPVALSAASQGLALCPEAPATVSAKLGRPGQRGFRQPEGILDAWIFQYGWCPDAKAGGRADLCLPENGGQSHCPFEHCGWWEEPGFPPASGGSTSSSRVALGVPPAVWPSPRVQPRASLALSSRSCGWSTSGPKERPRASRCQTSQVCFEKFHTSGLSCLQFRERAPTPPENGPGRGLNCRKNSRGWE